MSNYLLKAVGKYKSNPSVMELGNRDTSLIRILSFVQAYKEKCTKPLLK